MSLRFGSKASGPGGAPPLHIDAGQDDKATARSISAHRTIESPARDLAGPTTNLPPASTSELISRLQAE
jgi:hypothetical protein